MKAAHARARFRAARAASDPFTERSGPAHPSPLERAICRHADRRGLRLRPLAGPRRHPLAGGRHRATVGAQYVFLRDVQRGDVWSAGYQPTGTTPDGYEAVFAEDRAEIRRRDGAISTTLELVVSPEDDAEVRRITLTNLGTRTREIELTSYAEVALAPPAADAAHPAFSNLFVQTEFVPRRLGAARLAPAAHSRRAR